MGSYIRLTTEGNKNMSLYTKYIRGASREFHRTSLVLILILLEVYFLINGDAHFVDWSANYSQTTMVYLIMVVSFMLFAGKETQEEMNIPFTQSLANFSFFAIATFFLMSFVIHFGNMGGQQVSSESFWSLLVLQFCIVATSEELMFRGVLLEQYGKIISSLLFALWHTFAYGIRYYDAATLSFETLIPFTIAFIMGLILASIIENKSFGLPSTIAVHAVYNCMVIGLFTPFGGILG